MQRFTNSSISIRRNRFRETGSKFEPILITKIDLGTCLNSNNLKEEFYTNYVNTPGQKVYNLIEELYLKIVNNEDNIFSGYTFDELYYNGRNIDRLIRIINKYNSCTYNLSDLPNIYKLKNNIEPKIHLYIKISNNTALVLLIDLYHLSIPGDLYFNHRLVKRISFRDLENIYDKYNGYNYNLNTMIKSDEKELRLVS